MKPATALLLGLFSTSSVYSNDELPEQEVIVRDKIEAPLTSKETLTSEDIKKRPTGDGNITDLLKTNPAVQFSNSGNNGLSQGEIKPSDISIHGSTAYQNSFTLDGMSINNDIDPADNGLGVTNSNLSSDEQGFYLDSRLIESVTVYDANVPVEFGGFTGGVVETTSRSWQGATSANVYYRQTDSSWNKTHVDDKLEFNSSNNDVSNPARFQPDYVKRSYGVTFETGITDDLGFVASISRRTSSIPMANIGTRSVEVSNGKLIAFETPDSLKDQARTSDNIFTKWTWYASARTTANLSIAVSKYEAELFQNRVANSNYTDSHDGLSTNLQLEHMFDSGTLNSAMGFQRMSDHRISEQNYAAQFQSWDMATSKLVTYSSGGPGSLNTEQNNWNLKSKFSFNPISIADSTNQFVLGTEITRTDASFIRDETYFINSYAGMWEYLDPNATPNQVTAFSAGTYKAKYTNYALYSENTIEIYDWTLRAGLRFERDDFVKNNNLSPRLAVSWDPFSDGSTVLTMGANRYYGRSMLTYALYAGQNGGLMQCYFCEPNNEHQPGWIKKNDFDGMSELKTPYNNELTAGLQQFWGNSIWSLNYVHRLGKDEVRSLPKEPGSIVRTFNNDGKTVHNSITLSVRNRVPLSLLSSQNTFNTSLVWQETTSNMPKDTGYSDFETGRDLDYDKVWYDGKIIKASDLPSTDFNAPLRASFEWISAVPQQGVTVYNLLQWQGKREQATRDNTITDPTTGKELRKYQRVDFEDTFRWDLKAEWKPSFAKGAAVSAEITNLLDNKNATDSFVHEAEVYRIYEAGRQFWLQASYDY